MTTTASTMPTSASRRAVLDLPIKRLPDHVQNGNHSSASAGTVVTPALGRRDLRRAAGAVTDLLESLGVDPTSEELVDTPGRVARMLDELLTPEPFTATTFRNDAGYDEMVLVTGIEFTSLCEHHLLPFRGVAHVGYLPADRIIGLSKLARLVGFFAHRLQVQERMTTQVADWLRDHLEPRGVGVVLEAEHLCMSIRGVQSQGARTVTSTLYGHVRNDPAARQEFLQLARTTALTRT